MEKLPSLSVVIPCFNEAQNIEALLEEALGILPGIADSFELLVINDGSTDYTSSRARSMGQKAPEIKVIDKINGGYGSAVKTGLGSGRSEWFFLIDGDRQFRFEQLREFLPYADDFDFIIGCRKHRADPLYRTVNAQLLRVFVFFLLKFPLSIQDINCAFKLMRASALNDCLPLVSDGAMVMTELLFKALSMGIRIKQLPVEHLPRQYGAQTGAKPRVIFKAMREAIALKKYLKHYE